MVRRESPTPDLAAQIMATKMTTGIPTPRIINPIIRGEFSPRALEFEPLQIGIKPLPPQGARIFRFWESKTNPWGIRVSMDYERRSRRKGAIFPDQWGRGSSGGLLVAKGVRIGNPRGAGMENHGWGREECGVVRGAERGEDEIVAGVAVMVERKKRTVMMVLWVWVEKKVAVGISIWKSRRRNGNVPAVVVRAVGVWERMSEGIHGVAIAFFSLGPLVEQIRCILL
ncbi:hypothetical protein MRB53_033983 [Persea americana]|uniref:Uncharacterized protein n=1 Tax=Persea americana TaxID=3435 RepID=A0ACC2KXG2_PERAE|nr:hypothetical protein MRB53_033983 [Persea americana]